MDFTKTLGGLLLIGAGIGMAVHHATRDVDSGDGAEIVIYQEDSPRAAQEKSDRIVDHGRAEEIERWLKTVDQYEESGPAFEALRKAQDDRLERDKAQFKAWLYQWFGLDPETKKDRFDHKEVERVFGDIAEELRSR